MVNFMCQLDWATVCPDSTLFLDMSVKVFQDKIGIGISGLSKVDCLPQSGWASSNLLQIYLEQKAEEKTDCPVQACLLEMDMNLLLPSDWDLDHQHLLFSGLQTRARITLPVLLCLQLADHRL